MDVTERNAAIAQLTGLEHLPFASSLDAMRRVEDEIEKRGLQREYLRQLVGMQQGSVALDIDCLDYEGTTPRALWSLVCATPAQRTEAAYQVLKEHHAPTT